MIRAVVLLILCAFAAPAQDCDLIIRNGRVADGTGNPAFFADVGVKGGRVVRVGKIKEKGAAEIDATGMIVAPGFIDVHTHAEDIDDLPLAENFARMGVTTVVLGNCGSSVLNVGEFFKKLETAPPSINVATLIGHGTVRGKVMGGSFMRPPAANELVDMKGLVQRAMRDGAVGLSTGLIYLPGTFAKTEELIEVAKVAAGFGGVYASHMRDEGSEIDKSLAELFRIAREARIRAEISHIKLSGKNNWGRPAEIIAAIEKARAEGLDITQDQYGYDASSTGISQLIPDWAREGGKFRERIADPEQKAKIIDQMKKGLARGKRDSYAYAVIAEYKKDRSLNGLNLVQAAKKKRENDSLDAQISLIFEIQTNGGASAVFHSMSEEDLRVFLQHPNTMIASDSGVRRYREGVPHPRGYGNNARILGNYVRELHLLRLEDAIRKMTSLPAATFHIADRGAIRNGAWADIVVFDPATVQDNATFEDPHRYATGFRAVLVNGIPVVKDDAHTQARPGKPVRRDDVAGEISTFKHHFIDHDLPVNARGVGDYGLTALVDIDGDGDLDFVLGGKPSQPSQLYWFEFKSADEWVRHRVGTNYSSDVGLAALDVDGDGRKDLVCSGVWFRNPGEPRDREFERYVFDPNGSGAHDIVAADMDADGRLDIVMMGDERTKLNALCWYSIPADPKQTWSRHAIGSPVHGAITPAGVGDVDGDGDQDVIRADTWFENLDGKGKRWAEHKNIPMGRRGPFGVCVRTAIADLDGDGKAEVVILDADITESKAVVLKNQDGKGGAWTKRPLPQSFAYGSLHALAVADFNNDGRPDIITIEQEELLPKDRENPRCVIWENLGRGEFRERIVLDQRLGGHELQVGDVDGDGDIDVCSKPWGPRPWNSAGGKQHVDFLENLAKSRK